MPYQVNGRWCFYTNDGNISNGNIGVTRWYLDTKESGDSGVFQFYTRYPD